MYKNLNLLPLLLSLLFSNITHAQGNAISISNFTVKNQLPSNISEWGNTPGALLLVAQNNSWGDRPVRLLIWVKKGDNKICGISDGIALDYFKTRSFQNNDLLAALGNCEALPPGDYTLCAKFIGQENNRATATIDVSTEVCKPFTVGGGNADAQKYTRPSLISPENNKVFTEQDFKKPITLRCIPVVPKPQEPVIYHFRIWQVAAGQTPIQAINGSQPVVEKEAENLAQTNITSGLFPCSPNCKFVWNVQATNREGKPYGENNGTSELANFSFADAKNNVQRNIPIIPDIPVTPVIRPCIKCNNIQITTGTATVNMNASTGILNLSQPLSVSPDIVKQLTAAIVYTEWKPQDEKCIPCDKDLRQWGALQSAVLNNTGSSPSGSVLNTSEAQWTINALMNSATMQFKIQFPALLSCCNLTGKICVRYKFILQPTNGECYECEKLVCYTF